MGQRIKIEGNSLVMDDDDNDSKIRCVFSKLKESNENVVLQADLFQKNMTMNASNKKFSELTNLNGSKSMSKTPKMEIVFAFACPTMVKKCSIKSGKNGTTSDLSELNYNLEFKVIDETMRKIRLAVNYKKVWAKNEDLQAICDLTPSVFHFSGHGFKDEKSKTGKDDFLLIENRKLESQELKSPEISKYFGKNSKIKVVLILSCHSQNIGQIFQNIGIEHVICIQRKFAIDDQSCITFTRAFYEQL